MKLCVFSDIHGNGAAFDSFFPLMKKESADLNIFLGDICGYYFEENEVWQQLVDVPGLVALRGNHDDLFVRASEGNQEILKMYSSSYGSSLELFLKKDHQSMTRWVKELPISYTDAKNRFFCCHGSPRNLLEEYVYPDSSLAPLVDGGCGICFLGHTHYSMVRDYEGCLFVNPGSVGQPRDGDWPSFAVVDLKEKNVVLKHFRYDVQKTLRKIDEVGDQFKYLREVVERIGSHD